MPAPKDAGDRVGRTPLSVADRLPGRKGTAHVVTNRRNSDTPSPRTDVLDGPPPRPTELATDGRVCPLPCIPDHEELANTAGRVRATECTVCGNLVGREAWLAILREAAR